jgi:hypothetical protein
MSDMNIVTAGTLDKVRLETFLSRFYSKPKCGFLEAYGTWWHHADHNRWAILVDGEIAAYCAVIPTKCLINGVQERAWWWIDLVVAPEFRGRGLQAFFDREVRNMSDVKLGFPNKLAAKIHRGHGWGVREDFAVFILPLRPGGMKIIRNGTGARGTLLRTGAGLLGPVAMVWRHYVRHCKTRSAYPTETVSASLLEGIFFRYQESKISTVYRDAESFFCRYLNSPYRSELAFYLAGPPESPSHYLIARHGTIQGVKVTRILDLFGDFSQIGRLRDIVLLAVKEAIQLGSTQVSMMVTLPELRSVLQSVGFLIATKTRFCWHSHSKDMMQALGQRCYWTLGDSDADAPE